MIELKPYQIMRLNTSFEKKQELLIEYSKDFLRYLGYREEIINNAFKINKSRKKK